MSSTKFDKNIKIGVIGAGAAGLSAANALKRKGYKNITILEKSDRPGGKTCTFFVDSHSYELGTVFFATYYKNTFQLLKRYNLNSENLLSKLSLSISKPNNHDSSHIYAFN